MVVDCSPNRFLSGFLEALELQKAFEEDEEEQDGKRHRGA